MPKNLYTTWEKHDSCPEKQIILLQPTSYFVSFFFNLLHLCETITQQMFRMTNFHFCYLKTGNVTVFKLNRMWHEQHYYS